MCFRFGSCFGGGSGQDYGRSASKATHHGGGHQPDHRYYNGSDQKSGPQAYHQKQPAASYETQRNAQEAGAGARKDHVDDASGYGHAQDKADDTLKHPAAWSSKVGEERLQEDAAAAADHREHAAADHHHHPTTITTTAARD